MNERGAGSKEERDYDALERRAYSMLAPFYDVIVFPFRSLRRQVASAVALPPGARVLDVATGTGEQAFAFAGKAGAFVAPAQHLEDEISERASSRACRSR